MWTKRITLWILVVLLTLAALHWEGIPAMGSRCVIRATAVCQGDGTYMIGLICQQPGQAANSEEVTEQMQLFWGQGNTLAAAFGGAEQQLPGRPEYKLCNTVLADGSTTLASLKYLAEYVAQTGSGRLAARIVGLRQQDIRQDTDVSALCYAISTKEDDAPRLYQAAESGLLLPQVTWENNSLRSLGAAYLTESGQCRLSVRQADLAWLLSGGGRTLNWEIEGQPVQLCMAAGKRAISGQEAEIFLEGWVRGLPQEGKARIKLLAVLQSEVQRQLAALIRRVPLDEVMHAAAYIALHEGKAAEEAQRLRFYMHLAAEPVV